VEQRELAGRIDLAFLRIDGRATVDALRSAVQQVEQLGLRSLSVPPLLAGTVKKNYPQVKVCAVVAYPLGTESLATKIFSCSELFEQRVDEVDVVLDLFALVNDNRRKIEHEARELADHAQRHGVYLKAIIETPILSEAQVRWATEVLCDTGVPCIKTSTGYGREPTSLEHVKLIRAVAANRAKIKSSGGIRGNYDALAMLDAGADIIGASDAAALLQVPKSS
jgi:deoxyribose-phosphate aldolase